MKPQKGKTVCGGVAIGKIYIYDREENTIVRKHTESCEAEIERFEQARQKAISDLTELYNKTLENAGESGAKIFDIHKSILNDPNFIETIENFIADDMLNAEAAVGYTCDGFVQIFKGVDDAYIRGRDADIKDVSERLICVLEDKAMQHPMPDEPVILVADDLAPSETVQLDKDKILAIVTRHGSTNSHTAILARMMGIPAIVGADGVFDKQFNGETAVVDAIDGYVYVNPMEKILSDMQKKQDEYAEHKKRLDKLKGMESVTLDGKYIELCANIGNVLDIGGVIANDAEGIGLFRTEFLYMESHGFPSEDAQFEVYRETLLKMSGKRTVIRTVDLGADKLPVYFHYSEEPNPAMGNRAIRVCFENRDIFITQLRALFRASIYGKLAIMFPMIASEWEIIEILDIIKTVKSELAAEGTAYSDDVEIGCMIETPAAAIISDDLAKHLDFLSIGTNDLTQYTLAADRLNPAVSKYYDPRHKSILRLISSVVKNAHEKGKWVGICGELGADPELTEIFLAMGVDELSVSSDMILTLRERVRSTDISKVRERVEELIK